MAGEVVGYVPCGNPRRTTRGGFMALGPLEILVFGFPTPSPGREVTEALATTQLAGDLRVIDVLLIT
ncbi:MAG: hypothetical protein H0T70_09590, partial [Acidimicrobiia bacterium]|nr:hypothetical protein [Acidimicrobiia bacterium]